MSETAQVSARAKQAGTTPTPTQWEWVDRAIWTERMLAALGNGVRGNKWFSLIDDVSPITNTGRMRTSPGWGCSP